MPCGVFGKHKINMANITNNPRCWGFDVFPPWPENRPFWGIPTLWWVKKNRLERNLRGRFFAVWLISAHPSLHALKVRLAAVLKPRQQVFDVLSQRGVVHGPLKAHIGRGWHGTLASALARLAWHV